MTNLIRRTLHRLALELQPIDWLRRAPMTNIGRRHTLQSLAVEVGMSARSLARHFVHETGITPRKFVERARIDAARI